jgi:hypothetical protein
MGCHFQLAATGLKALTAIYGATIRGLEGDLRSTTALITHNVKHFTGTTGGTAGSTTSGATSGLVLEAFLGEKGLLISRENELFAAFFTNQGFVLIH